MNHKKMFLQVNSILFATVFMLMAFITVFLLWNKSVAAEEPRTEVCFDVEAGVASLMEMEDEAADKWATTFIFALGHFIKGNINSLFY